MKHIIVEGFDGTGKSTLIEELSHGVLNFPVKRAGGPPRDDNHALDCCTKQLEEMHNPIEWLIFDRVTPISRLCYQFDASKGHKVGLNAYLNAMLELSVIIWCDTDVYETNHLVKEYDTKEHLEFINKYGPRIRSNYADLMAKLPGVIRYDFKHHTIEDLLLRIDEVIQYRSIIGDK